MVMRPQPQAWKARELPVTDMRLSPVPRQRPPLMKAEYARPTISSNILYRSVKDQKPSAKILFLPDDLLLVVMDHLPDHVDRFCLAMTCHGLLCFVFLSDRVKCSLPLWKTPKLRDLERPPSHLEPRMDLLSRMMPVEGGWRLCIHCCQWQTADEYQWARYLTRRRSAERTCQHPGVQAMATCLAEWERKMFDWAGSPGGPCRGCDEENCAWRKTCPQCCLELDEVAHPPVWLWPVHLRAPGPDGEDMELTRPFWTTLWEPFTVEMLEYEYPDVLRDIVWRGWRWEWSIDPDPAGDIQFIVIPPPLTPLPPLPPLPP